MSSVTEVPDYLPKGLEDPARSPKPTSAESAEIRSACVGAIERGSGWVSVKVAGGTVYEVGIRRDHAMYAGRMLLRFLKSGIVCLYGPDRNDTEEV